MKRILTTLVCLALLGCASTKSPPPAPPSTQAKINQPAQQVQEAPPIDKSNDVYKVELATASFSVPTSMTLDKENSTDGVMIYTTEDHSMVFGVSSENDSMDIDRYAQITVIAAKLKNIDVLQIREGAIDNQRALMLVMRQSENGIIDLHFIVRNQKLMMNFDCGMPISSAKKNSKTCSQIIDSIKLK